MNSLFKNPVYWQERIITQLRLHLMTFIEAKEGNFNLVVERLDVRPSFIRNLALGKVKNLKLSNIVKLSLAVGKAPYLHLKDIKDIRTQ